MKRNPYLRTNLVLLPAVIMLAFAGQARAQSGYVGESIYLPAPSVPGILDAAGWYSDNTGAVSVSGNISGATVRIDSYFSGQVTVTCQYAYHSGSYKNNGRAYYYISCKPSSLRLNENNVTLDPGQSVKLTYTNSSGFDLPFVAWTTSDEEIANINSDDHAYGVKTVTVKAVRPGECIITCNGNTGTEAPTCTITVRNVPATGISLTPEKLTLQEGKSGRFECRMTPEGASSETSWSSSDEGVATVSASGRVTATGEGTATITVSTDNGLSAKAMVEVSPAPDQVTLPSSLQVTSGYSMVIRPELVPSNAMTGFEWETDNDKVASVDDTGRVKGKTPGTADITVKTSNGKSATCKVTVKEPSEGMDYRNVSVRISVLEELIGESSSDN